MIEFKQVLKRYPGGLDALKHVSVFIPRGSITFLTGHSGAGKSTMLRLVTLSEVATRGQVFVNDEDISLFRKDRIALHRRTIGSVFQDHKLLPDRTVEENVALPLIVSGMENRDCARRARAALDKVGLLKLCRRFPQTLSAGEQQRVGIARAVVGRPDILLADEPTGNLDPELADEIMRLFFLFNQHDVTVIIATHDYRHLNNPAAGLLALENGQVRRDSYS